MLLIAPKILDIHLADKCNLRCDGCNHFSNYGFQEIHSLETIKTWVEPWKNRLIPQNVNLVGGEPFLNKEIFDILPYIRNNFSRNINVFTNGLLISKYKNEILEYFNELNINLIVSIQSKTEQTYINKVHKALSELKVSSNKTKVIKKSDYSFYIILDNIRIEVRDMSKHWYRTYKGSGADMKPYSDNKPRQSWENCVSKDSVQLYNGKLYKCNVITYLPATLDKLGIKDPEWDKYLTYKPLASDCTDHELYLFNLKEEEKICGMCPANPEWISDKKIY